MISIKPKHDFIIKVVSTSGDYITINHASSNKDITSIIKSSFDNGVITMILDGRKGCLSLQINPIYDINEVKDMINTALTNYFQPIPDDFKECE
jgi:hypothetical protein